MISKKFKELQLVFENCEYGVIPYSAIVNFALSGYKKEIRRIAINSIAQLEEYTNFLVTVNYEELKGCAQRGLFSIDDEMPEAADLTNLARTDITSIKLVYKEEDSANNVEAVIPWGDEEYDNTFCHSERNEDNDNTFCHSERNEDNDILLWCTDGKDEDFLRFLDEVKAEFHKKKEFAHLKKLYSVR